MNIMRRIPFTALASIGLVCLCTGSTGLPQAPGQPQSMKGVVIKGKAPVSKEVLKVTLPKAFESKLGNGLQVVVLENHKLPVFAVQMVVLSGGISDPADQHGVAQFTASMLREGTKTRNSREIAEQVESLGASLVATSGLSTTTSTVATSGLMEQFDPIMALFADVVLNPSFPADELKKIQARTVAQLRAQRSVPGFLAAEMFSKVLYGQHPAGRVAPSPEEVQRLTPEALASFHATWYRPNNAIFAIVGDVRPDAVIAALEKAFGTWKRGEISPVQVPAVADPGAARICVIDRPGSVQTNFLLGGLTIDRTDPDYPALSVANRIIGGSPSARLFMNLREDKGYTYGAYSNFTAYKFRGAFQANTEVRTDVTEGAMKELTYELRRLADEMTPPDELENARRSIVGSFALQLESPQSLLQNVITQKIYGLPADYWETYPRKISAVTAEDVQRVARKYLDIKRVQVVAVGDAKKIAGPLRNYGPVEVFDTEGKPTGQ
jgi:zinc protease